MGICHNNIGNIHLKSFRFSEAIDSYEQAVSIIDAERAQVLKKQPNTRKISNKEIYLNESYRKYTKIWANRLFQLAEAKLEKIFHESIIEKSKKHVKDLDDVIELYNTSKSTFSMLGGMSFSKTITISIKTSFAYLIQEEIEKAEEMIVEAESFFKILEKRGFENLDVPESVLMQKLLVQKGLLAKKKGRYREAVEFFTLSLENCQLYDPRTKKQYDISSDIPKKIKEKINKEFKRIKRDFRSFRA